MKYLILLSLTLNACMTPSYITKHGIKVYDKTTYISPTKHEVENVTSFVIKHLGHAEKLNGTGLMLVSVWLHMGRKKSSKEEVLLADGYTDIYKKQMIASVFQTCFADSGAVHEMAHIIHDVGKAVPDWFHDDKEFWNKTVKKMESDIIKELCPKDYVHKKIEKDYIPPNKID